MRCDVKPSAFVQASGPEELSYLGFPLRAFSDGVNSLPLRF